MVSNTSPPKHGDAETSPLLQGTASAARDVEATPDPAPPSLEGNPEMYKKLHLLMPAVAIGILLSALDFLIPVAAAAKIGSDLNALNSISWVANSYFITLTSCQPLYGKLSDIFGRKQALLFAYTVFAIGCICCGLSQNMLQLCLARAFTGIGGGGMTTVVAILLSDIVPLRERGEWQGYMNFIYATGTSSGAPLGGFLADSIGWRWSFIAQAPLCAIAFVAVYFVLDIPKKNDGHWQEKIKRVDFLGALTLVLAVVALLLGLDNGSNIGWTELRAIVPLILAPCLFIAFILVEIWCATNPFAPGHVIFDRNLFPCFVINFFGMGSHFGTLFFAPLFLQAVNGWDATSSGSILVPSLAISVAASVGSGAILKRTDKFRTLAICGYMLAPPGVALIIVGMALKSPWLLGIGLAIPTIGVSAGTVTSLVGMLAHAALEDTAVVVATSYLFRALGSSLMVGLSSAVLQQTLRTGLSRRLPVDAVDEIEEKVRQNLDYINTLPKALADIVRSSYQLASMHAMVPCFIFGLSAFVITFWVRDKALKR